MHLQQLVDTGSSAHEPGIHTKMHAGLWTLFLMSHAELCDGSHMLHAQMSKCCCKCSVGKQCVPESTESFLNSKMGDADAYIHPCGIQKLASQLLKVCLTPDGSPQLPTILSRQLWYILFPVNL